MAIFVSRGDATAELSQQDVEDYLGEFLAGLAMKPRKVLLIPPDFSRYHSAAGEICALLYRRLSLEADVALLPALGTHRPMTAAEMNRMFPGVPHERIRVHDWQKGLVQMGEIPGRRLRELSGGKVDYPVRIEVDRLVAEGGYDLIISAGQVVPHEVIGMAGGNKNILVGTAGPDTINKSHFLGAVCNMEKIMGIVDTPVRALLDEAEDRFLRHLPIHYILTVRSKNQAGQLVTRGLFAASDRRCFAQAAQLSRQVNIIKVPPLRKVVVYLDPAEFKSTWIGNKAIYRTRMAIADGGELLILAPGLVEFGEAEVNERYIRKYGYCGAEATLKAVAADAELRNSLGAAAHLIHGSSEGRFTITYASGGLPRKDIEAVGFRFTELAPAMARYNPERLSDGFNTLPDGEKIYYISNPALGLWQAELTK
jgi:nickel-dependent lactate racemase